MRGLAFWTEGRETSAGITMRQAHLGREKAGEEMTKMFWGNNATRTADFGWFYKGDSRRWGGGGGGWGGGGG